MKSFLTRQYRLTFAGALFGLLEQPKSIGCIPPDSIRKSLTEPCAIPVVKGSLRLKEHGEVGETVVGLELAIPTDWMTILPIASTDAVFLRDDREWHVPQASFLCYGLNSEWRWQLDELLKIGLDSTAIIQKSSAWCIRNIDSLITRHLIGHRYGLVEWPEKWGDWSHGEDGVREFSAWLRTRGRSNLK